MPQTFQSCDSCGREATVSNLTITCDHCGHHEYTSSDARHREDARLVKRDLRKRKKSRIKFKVA